MNDLVSTVFQHADFGGGSSEPRVADSDALLQHVSCLAIDFDLFQKEVKELVVPP